MNEAAAQICKFVPALLTRRDELFPLARQLVKDCGFGHSASIARFSMAQQTLSTTEETGDSNTSKRARVASDTTTHSTDYKVMGESRKFGKFQILENTPIYLV